MGRRLEHRSERNDGTADGARHARWRRREHLELQQQRRRPIRGDGRHVRQQSEQLLVRAAGGAKGEALVVPELELGRLESLGWRRERRQAQGGGEHREPQLDALAVHTERGRWPQAQLAGGEGDGGDGTRELLTHGARIGLPLKGSNGGRRVARKVATAARGARGRGRRVGGPAVARAAGGRGARVHGRGRGGRGRGGGERGEGRAAPGACRGGGAKGRPLAQRHAHRLAQLLDRRRAQRRRTTQPVRVGVGHCIGHHAAHACGGGGGGGGGGRDRRRRRHGTAVEERMGVPPEGRLHPCRRLGV